MSDKLKQLLRRIRGPLLPLSDPRFDGRLVSCAICRARTVNPVDWAEHGPKDWWVLLRCGECGWAREEIISEAEARQLERDLEPGLRKIAAQAARLDRERMEYEVDVFVAALERDLIGPADFADRLRH
jgi:hypothetical protein